MAAPRSAHACICIVLSTSCLTSCGELQFAPAVAVAGSVADGAGVSGPTATVARNQNWDCQRIERAIASLIEVMRSAKTRAEVEQEQMPQTLARMFARLSGAPGAGNVALTEFQETRKDADQLNDLLREKGCARSTIDIQAPAFLQR